MQKTNGKSTTVYLIRNLRSLYYQSVVMLTFPALKFTFQTLKHIEKRLKTLSFTPFTHSGLWPTALPLYSGTNTDEECSVVEF